MQKIKKDSPPTELNWWKSPTTLLTVVIGIILLAGPIFIDLKTSRIISALYADVSQSNQEYKFFIKQLCKTHIEHLKEGDIRINGKFADKTFVNSNQAFEERDRLTLQSACKDAATPPEGIGKTPGTPLLPALNSFEQEIQKQRTLGNKNRAIGIFAIQEDEPLKNQSPEKSEEFTAKVESLTKSGNLVLFIGPDVKLQNQLKSALAKVNNTNVCTYENSKQCLEWAFTTARKKP